ILGIYRDLLALSFRRREADLIQHALHDRMQTSRSDIFRAFVHAKCKASNFSERLLSELKLYALSFKQRSVLLDQRRLRLGQNSDKVVHGERLQLNTNGKAPLQFRNQVAGL